MAKWFAKLLGLLCLLVLAGLAGVVGWGQAVAPSDPNLVLRIIPDQRDALIALAEETRRSKPQSSVELTRISSALMRRAPLLDAPLVYTGVDLVAKGEQAAARQAFSLAVKRQPRNVPALSWLAADAIGDHRIKQAIELLERLAILDPGQENLYSEALAGLVSHKQGAESLESLLAKGSSLANKTLNRLSVSSDDIPLLLRLSAYSPEAQGLLVMRLLKERGVLPAFVAWLSLAPQAEVRAMSWPFDPTFVGSTAPPPFNWRISEGAELLEQGGLYISYSGRGAPVFAEQVMMLGPGRYAFQVEMDGNAETSGGSFEWRLQCYPAGPDLGSLAILFLGPTLSPHEFKFDVPRAGKCAAQHLTLRGLPGEFPTRVRATVRRVSLQSAKGAAG